METLQGTYVRQFVSKSVYAKKYRDGPFSANQGLSTSEPRHGHAVCTLWVHPPTSPCPTLSAHAEPGEGGLVYHVAGYFCGWKFHEMFDKDII